MTDLEKAAMHGHVWEKASRGDYDPPEAFAWVEEEKGSRRILCALVAISAAIVGLIGYLIYRLL